MLGDFSAENTAWTRPALLTEDDLNRQRLLDDEFGALAQVAAVLAGQRASLKAQEEKAERTLKLALHPNVSASLLHQKLDELAAGEARSAAEMRPIFDRLILLGEREPPEDRVGRAIRRNAEDAVDIGVAWLELLQNTRLRLLKIASDKMAKAERPRPIINSADELEREFEHLTGE